MDTKEKARMGRPPRYKEAAIARALHLPISFWELLDVHGGSRTVAFLELLSTDAGVKKIRRLLKKCGA